MIINQVDTYQYVPCNSAMQATVMCVGDAFTQP